MEYLLITAILIILFNFYNKIALKYNIVDIPNKRSSHSKITIRGGGIIFPISAILWFIVSGFQYPWFIGGLLFISLISFWDDLSPLPYPYRLLAHIISLYMLSNQIGLDVYPWLVWILLVLLMTGIINAYNFMDGINGMTGVYSLSVILSIWIVNNFQISFIDNSFIYILAISLLIFNYFNFRISAKCFAGDIGSISIAYILVFLLAKLVYESKNLVYILFLLIYGVDTLYTITYRIILRENIFKAHRKHLYQILANENKVPHIKVASYYAISQLIICLIIIVSYRYSFMSIYYLGLGLLITMILAFHFIRINIIHKVNKVQHDVNPR